MKPPYIGHLLSNPETSFVERERSSRWVVRVALLREALRADLGEAVTNPRVPLRWWTAPKDAYETQAQAAAAVAYTFRVATAAFRRVHGDVVPYPPLIHRFLSARGET